MAERIMWGLESTQGKEMRAQTTVLLLLLRKLPGNLAVIIFTTALGVLSLAQSGAVPDTVAWRDVGAVCITIIGFFGATMISSFRKEQKLMRSALLKLAIAIKDNDRSHLYEIIADLSDPQ